MNVVVERATEADKPLIAHLVQLYEHDLTEFTGGGPGEDGLFELGAFFDLYWIEDERHPFKILVDDRPAGFAWVREVTPGVWSMAEFFVLRGYRKTGVAGRAALQLFQAFAGEWHVAEDWRNEPAQRFWRRVIGEFSGGDFVERESESQPCGPEQVFRSGGT